MQSLKKVQLECTAKNAETTNSLVFWYSYNVSTPESRHLRAVGIQLY